MGLRGEVNLPHPDGATLLDGCFSDRLSYTYFTLLTVHPPPAHQPHAPLSSACIGLIPLHLHILSFPRLSFIATKTCLSLPSFSLINKLYSFFL